MKKRTFALFLILTLTTSLFLKVPVKATEPEIMSALRSHIQVYGPIENSFKNNNGLSTSKITYQDKKKRFLFQYTFTNGNSTCTIKMYMPATKKKATYTVSCNQIIRAKNKIGKLSGKASLKRKTYNNINSNLRFSRKNKNKAAKKIKGKTYQKSANSFLRAAFSMWESGLESKTTLCFPNFGFSKVYVFDKSSHTNEW